MTDARQTERASIDPKLLELLACPLTKGSLKWDAARSELVSVRAGLAYPVREGVPVMLASEARPLEPEKARRG
ncbi:Trm112 family protein [Chelativorans sp. AA-79]|uniref:Trm112 family protein n=1 Tax=Chelativorans sp. AA-79 TaxID=3028735 RepID=UPI0023F9C826|nr:Trm112 family protein [Chelativorans sp. AA-79]WEX09629.1 Trm112 family protein [Chelativorans sp. AA-79]